MSTQTQQSPELVVTGTGTGTGTGAGTVTRVLQRVVLPVDADQDVLPLYVDGELNAGAPGPDGQPASSSTAASLDQVAGRRRFVVPAGGRSSFGTYFNAFPASYWRRWTVVDAVQLRVRTSGGGSVVVYRSNAKGNIQRVAAETVGASGDRDGAGAGDESTFSLTLKPFNDGGWYWFDLVAGREELVLEEAAWTAQVPAAAPSGRATIAITTLNRADFCAPLLRTLAGAPELDEVLAEVVVIDQGTKKVADDAQDYPVAAEQLGERLRMIDQANLGGSGGFSRGMLEALRAGSDYVLLLDDDVMVEPEGIARAVVFADLCRSTTIVGGHMFSMFSRSLLHAYAEGVQKWRFWWGPVSHSEHDHDLAAQNLRGTPWLHRRFDVDYNGWFMCLIPRAALEQLGLSLPLFIKWDDAEYGLRAQAADIPTVSLPGAAVWHVPWTDKDDAIDWQAYHHARNRVVAALLHSPYTHGGNVVRESLTTQVKHLLSMQYSTAELRLLALEDVFRGPEAMHADLPTKLGQVRAMRAQHSDAVYQADATAYPATKRRKPPRHGKEPEVPTGRAGVLATALSGVLKQVRGVDELAEEHPQASVAHMDARWWMLSQFDSALVSSADGTGMAWYRRDRRRFTGLMRRTVAVHQRLAREWPALASSYRASLAQVASPQAWERTIADAGKD